MHLVMRTSTCITLESFCWADALVRNPDIACIHAFKTWVHARTHACISGSGTLAYVDIYLRIHVHPCRHVSVYQGIGLTSVCPNRHVSRQLRSNEWTTRSRTVWQLSCFHLTRHFPAWCPWRYAHIRMSVCVNAYDMCMCISGMYGYIYIYKSKHTHTHTYLCTYVCIHTYIHTYTHVYIHACIYIYIYIYIYTRARTHNV